MERLTEATLGTSHTSLWFGDSQYAQTSGGGVWIVNGRKITCIVQAVRGAVACDTTANFVNRGLLLVVYKVPKSPAGLPRHFLALGVVPDWVQSARLKVGSTTRLVPVRGNAYALHADAPIDLGRLEG
jgi:hypothetical protein